MKTWKLIKSIIPEETRVYLRRKQAHAKYTRHNFWGSDAEIIKKRDLFFDNKAREGLSDIPVFIISFNRLSYVKQMIEWLEKKNIKQIYIIDNASDYQPLLDYYKTIPYKVFYMKRNYGHMVFWKVPIFAKFRKDFYIVSDPDVAPVDKCPDDFINVFFDLLRKYPNVRKVGFSLKIDDLPETPLKPDILRVERKYYMAKIKKDNCYAAEIDTTFALYLPDSLLINKDFYSAMRTGYPYQLRHLPWYVTREDLTEEDEHYSSTKSTGFWDVYQQKLTVDYRPKKSR